MSAELLLVVAPRRRALGASRVIPGHLSRSIDEALVLARAYLGRES